MNNHSRNREQTKYITMFQNSRSKVLKYQDSSSQKATVNDIYFHNNLDAISYN